MENPYADKSCTVCFSDFKKFTRPIICPFCPNEDSLVCRECTEEYLLGSTKDAHCMTCNHGWGYKFLNENFPSTFVTGKYRKSRQKVSLERQKILLPDTLYLVEDEKKKAKIKKEIAKLNKKRAKVIEKIKQMEKELLYPIDVEILARREIMATMKGGTTTKEEYISPCPIEDCRGFIEAATGRCGLCEIYLCKKCHEVLAYEKELKRAKRKHECDENDVASVKNIMKETRPCPKCKKRIFKIEGCDQMYCTQCQIAFSWNSGKVETGTIHNPHYYQMQRELGQQQRNIGDVPCGGLPAIYMFDTAMRILNPQINFYITYLKAPRDLASFISLVHRRTGEIEGKIQNLRRANRETDDKLQQARLDYLIGRNTEKEWQSAVFRIERANQKRSEEIQILESYLAVMIERFRDFVEKTKDANKNKIEKLASKLVKDAKKIIRFCNKAFKENMTALNYKKFPQIIVTDLYGRKLFSEIVIIGKENEAR